MENPVDMENYKTELDDLREASMSHFADTLRKNIENLANCVFITGSSEVQDGRIMTVCESLGQRLANQKDVVLVTTGRSGVQELVAKAFASTLESSDSVKNLDPEGRKEFISSRIIHVLPLRDFSEGIHMVSQGKTVLAGTSIDERDSLLAKLLNICILIGGDDSNLRVAENFIWNDHYVVPIATKALERPNILTENQWQTLTNDDTEPEDVALTAVETLFEMRQCIIGFCVRTKDQKKSRKMFKKKERKQERKSSNNSVNSCIEGNAAAAVSEEAAKRSKSLYVGK